MRRYRIVLTVLLALLFCIPVSPGALAAETGEGVKEHSVSFRISLRWPKMRKWRKLLQIPMGI